MAEATTPLAATIREFDAARGNDMDSVWAHGVSWALLMREVDAAQVREGLQEALELVRQTQTSPEELYGEAGEHADELYRRWLSEGRLLLVDQPPVTWREMLRYGLALTGVYAVLLFVVTAVRDDPVTPWSVARLLLVSLTVGMGSFVLLSAWSRRHRYASRPVAPDAPAEVQWSLRLTEILRSRYAMGGTRVRAIVSEASAHAAESGRPVQEEFGTPEEYAAGFAPDVARKARLTAAAFAALAVLNALFLFDGFSWFTTAFCALLVWMAVGELRRHT